VKRAKYQEKISEIPASKRIYIDECGVSRRGYRKYARALRGKRVFGIIPGKRQKRINVVAGLRDGEIIADYCYHGSMNSSRFEDWFCKYLLPATRKGDTIIMDNASYHNKKRLTTYARIHGVTIIFLPPYSPDYNLIEKVWANLKRFLRNYSGRFQATEIGIYWYFCVAYS